MIKLKYKKYMSDLDTIALSKRDLQILFSKGIEYGIGLVEDKKMCISELSREFNISQYYISDAIERGELKARQMSSRKNSKKVISRIQFLAWYEANKLGRC